MTHNRSYYVVNGITLYRLVAAPFLIFLIIFQKPDLFKWLLPVSFFTDAIDGFIARRYNAISVFGSKLDSIADDLTIVAAIVGAIVFKHGFLGQEISFIIPLLALYLIQNILALIRYRKTSSFHTYIAKAAAVLQGIFLILLFFLPQPLYILFYVMTIVTMLDLLEEAILVLILPKWQTDVKGVYWVIKDRSAKKR